MHKLKALKDVIKHWTKNEREKEREELNSLFTDLGELDSKNDIFGLDEEGEGGKGRPKG